MIRTRILPAASASMLLLACSLLATIGPARAAGMATLQGRVLTDANQPVAGAMVADGPYRATADASGNYSIQVPASRYTTILVWAPGYGERILSLNLKGISGTVSIDFSGPATGLVSGFKSNTYRASISGLPVQLPTSSNKTTFRVTSGTPLFGSFGVETPKGNAKLLKLRKVGNAYQGSFTSKAKGAYRVEILSGVALPIFNVLVFKGVKPVLPMDPMFPVEPTDRAAASLSSYILQLLNQVRSSHGLPAFQSNPKLTIAAQLHTAEMVKYNYFYLHPHTGRNGSTADQRVKAAGFRASSVGEDVGVAQTAEMLTLQWLHSPLHLHNILSNFKWAGIGIAPSKGNLYATIDFAN